MTAFVAAPWDEPAVESADRYPLLERRRTIGLWDRLGGPRVVNGRLAARALARFGQRTFPVATEGGAVIAGWEWVAGALELGWTELWVMVVDDDDETAAAWSIAAYRVGDVSHWNHRALLDVLDSLPAPVRDDAGFSKEAVRDLERKLVPTPIDELTLELAVPTLELGWGPLPVVPKRSDKVPFVRPHPGLGTVEAFKLLLSYWYFKKTDVTALRAQLGGDVQFFVDCGAFSAKTQGVEIAMSDYVAWLERWQDEFEAFVNFDVIGDAEATCRNQTAIEDVGVEALPVFHGHEDWRYLEAYCEQYPYVCLGGMVGMGGTGALRWVAKAFEIGAKYGAVFHGFGQTRPDMLMEFPWYSVDSSSWGSAHRYGQVTLWDHRTARFVEVNVGDARSCYENAELIREHGVDPERLADRNVYHGNFAAGVAAMAWRKYGDFLRERHGAVELRDGSRSPGLHLYLVDGSSGNLVGAATHCMETRV